MATSTVLSSSNLKRRLRLAIIKRLLSWPVLAARSVATHLRNIVAWGPIPLVVENTRPLRPEGSFLNLGAAISVLSFFTSLMMSIHFSCGLVFSVIFGSLTSKNAISIGAHRPIAACLILFKLSNLLLYFN